MEWSILCFFYCFLFRLGLEREEIKKSIKQTKNAPFHARSGNGPKNDGDSSFRIAVVQTVFSLQLIVFNCISLSDLNRSAL